MAMTLRMEYLVCVLPLLLHPCYRSPVYFNLISLWVSSPFLSLLSYSGLALFYYYFVMAGQ